MGKKNIRLKSEYYNCYSILQISKMFVDVQSYVKLYFSF